MALHDEVCDGCWKRGRCIEPARCRCRCEKDGWNHADRACTCGLNHPRGHCDGGR